MINITENTTLYKENSGSTVCLGSGTAEVLLPLPNVGVSFVFINRSTSGSGNELKIKSVSANIFSGDGGDAGGNLINAWRYEPVTIYSDGVNWYASTSAVDCWFNASFDNNMFNSTAFTALIIGGWCVLLL